MKISHKRFPVESVMSHFAHCCTFWGF